MKTFPLPTTYPLTIVLQLKGHVFTISGSWGPFYNEEDAHSFAESHGVDQGREINGDYYRLLFVNNPANQKE